MFEMNAVQASCIIILAVFALVVLFLCIQTTEKPGCSSYKRVTNDS